METDGYDPWADPEQTPQEIYDRGFYSGGGGGGSGYVSVRYDNNTNRLIPDLTQIQFPGHQPTPEEVQEMTWTNSEAADIAREILQEEKREGLREKVTEAVALYRAMLADAHCGSVYSFMKENDKGEHYWYAAIKNGDTWYTTAQNPRTIKGDEAFIEWLIGLGAHESKAAELTVGAAHEALALGPIDATSEES